MSTLIDQPDVLEDIDQPSVNEEGLVSVDADQDTKDQEMSESAIARQELLSYFEPRQLTWKNLDPVVATWMTGMHLGALAAPFFFTWEAVAVAVVLHWLTCSIGICLAYHRCLSHRSLKLKWPAKVVATFFGVIAGEGGPIRWSGTHRVHHGHSDNPGDPHSPLDGPWWAHLWWMMLKNPKRKDELLQKYYVPDLMKDKTMVFFERTFALWLWATGLTLLYVGGLPMLLWGMCVRMVFAYHSTWFVNSATHLWGYRNYETTDQSRNLWWVAILAYGEGWHNNHHAHPRLARAGHKWWELDPTWWAISLLRKIGQATDVDDRIPAESSAQA
ncbi:fatty acid desaturase [Thalassoglobus sp. JC818]|uniref:acyl-CoA desaturase n=1 Tax=Thalassoglobus sp. JC818 TaxID=3232136 RepID=UPI0034599092